VSQPGGRIALVQGASRGIGLALVEALRARDPSGQVFASCRGQASAKLLGLADADAGIHPVTLDVESPEGPDQAAETIARTVEGLDLVINCAGILHDNAAMQPEKRLREARPENLARSFAVNASGALLVAQAMEPLLRRGRAPLFASLSARVGSIEDNRLGGWYGYRASKAALNMFMRTLAIEWSRGSRPIRVVCLHPGTVATDLSAPFAGTDGNRPIFSPAAAADQLLDVLAGLDPADSGNFYAWDGSRIPW